MKLIFLEKSLDWLPLLSYLLESHSEIHAIISSFCMRICGTHPVHPNLCTLLNWRLTYDADNPNLYIISAPFFKWWAMGYSEHVLTWWTMFLSSPIHHHLNVHLINHGWKTLVLISTKLINSTAPKLLKDYSFGWHWWIPTSLGIVIHIPLAFVYQKLFRLS